MKFFVAMLLLVVLFSACQDNVKTIDEVEIAFSGKLVRNGEPLSYAIIKIYSPIQAKPTNDIQNIYSYIDTCDENGSFGFENFVENDAYQVDIEHDLYGKFGMNYKDFKAKTISTQNQNEFNIDEDGNCSANLNFSITDKSNISLNDVLVEFGKNNARYLQTNIDSSYSISQLCVGTYWLRLTKEGFNVLDTAIIIDSQNDFNFAFQMKSSIEIDTCCNGTLKLTYLDKDGYRITNAAIILTNTETGERLSKSSNLGICYFENLCQGTYSIAFESSAYNLLTDNISIDCKFIERQYIGKVAPLKGNKGRDCESDMYVSIVDTAGAYVVSEFKNVSLRITFEDGSSSATYYPKGKQFSIGNMDLRQGKAKVVITSSIYQVFSQEIILHYFPGGFTFVLTPNGVVEEPRCCNSSVMLKVIQDRTAASISGASVYMHDHETGEKHEGSTNTLGQITFNQVCKGSYYFSVSHPNYYGGTGSSKLEVNCEGNYTKYLELTAK